MFSIIAHFTFNIALPLCQNDVVHCACERIHIDSRSAAKGVCTKFRLLIAETGHDEGDTIVGQEVRGEDTVIIHDIRAVFGDFEYIERGTDDMDIYIRNCG